MEGLIRGGVERMELDIEGRILLGLNSEEFICGGVERIALGFKKKVLVGILLTETAISD